MLSCSMKRPVAIAMMLCFGLLLSPAHAASRGATASVASGACMAFDRVTSLSQAAPSIICNAAHHRLLIVGDEHGSNEIPDFVALLVKAASVNRPVRLGLEIEPSERGPIQAYVASQGTTADRAALLHDGYWSVGQGRMSQAIVRLIESVRALREQGRNVGIFTMVPDQPNSAILEKAGGITPYWNEGLAESVRVQLKAADSNHALIIAFMGKAHAALTKPAKPGDATATDRLLADSPYLVELAVHGKAWSCVAGGCGPHDVIETPAASINGAMLRSITGTPGAPAQALLRMPTLTPSPPAKEKPPKA